LKLAAKPAGGQRRAGDLEPTVEGGSRPSPTTRVPVATASRPAPGGGGFAGRRSRGTAKRGLVPIHEHRAMVAAPPQRGARGQGQRVSTTTTVTPQGIRIEAQPRGRPGANAARERALRSTSLPIEAGGSPRSAACHPRHAAAAANRDTMMTRAGKQLQRARLTCHREPTLGNRVDPRARAPSRVVGDLVSRQGKPADRDEVITETAPARATGLGRGVLSRAPLGTGTRCAGAGTRRWRAINARPTARPGRRRKRHHLTRRSRTCQQVRR